MFWRDLLSSFRVIASRMQVRKNPRNLQISSTHLLFTISQVFWQIWWQNFVGLRKIYSTFKTMLIYWNESTTLQVIASAMVLLKKIQKLNNKHFYVPLAISRVFEEICLYSYWDNFGFDIPLTNLSCLTKIRGLVEKLCPQ